MKSYTCSVCGAPGVLYKRHGIEFQRTHCAEHWREYMAARRDKLRIVAGIPDGWKSTRTHWLKPPAGVTRIVIDGYRQRVTVYTGDIWKTVHLCDLKHLTTTEKVLEFYRARHYRPTVYKHRWWVLEKAAA